MSVTFSDVDLYKNDHRFENWTPIWKFEKGHRSNVQMYVTLKSDMDLRIGHQLEAGRRSESYNVLYIYIS